MGLWRAQWSLAGMVPFHLLILRPAAGDLFPFLFSFPFFIGEGSLSCLISTFRAALQTCLLDGSIFSTGWDIGEFFI